MYCLSSLIGRVFVSTTLKIHNRTITIRILMWVYSYEINRLCLLGEIVMEPPMNFSQDVLSQCRQILHIHGKQWRGERGEIKIEKRDLGAFLLSCLKFCIFCKVVSGKKCCKHLNYGSAFFLSLKEQKSFSFDSKVSFFLICLFCVTIMDWLEFDWAQSWADTIEDSSKESL